MTQHFIPAEAFHPGEFLRDELTERGWTPRELAQRAHLPEPLIEMLLKNEGHVSALCVRRLAKALGTSEQFWTNLDAAYRRWRMERF